MYETCVLLEVTYYYLPMLVLFIEHEIVKKNKVEL